eukprot:758059-Hanusia_phi.AAC.2
MAARCMKRREGGGGLGGGVERGGSRFEVLRWSISTPPNPPDKLRIPPASGYEGAGQNVLY